MINKELRTGPLRNQERNAHEKKLKRKNLSYRGKGKGGLKKTRKKPLASF